MEKAEVFDEMLAVVDSCIARVGWRWRPYSKRHLSNDILALCMGLRFVTLVDYDRAMPELQVNLSRLLYHAQQESAILKPRRAMIISDMAYLIHVRGLSELAFPSLQLPHQLHLLGAETDPLGRKPTGKRTVQVQNMIAQVFPGGVDTDLLPVTPSEETKKIKIIRFYAE